MDVREKLIKMIQEASGSLRYFAELIADKLLAEGVIVPPENPVNEYDKLVRDNIPAIIAATGKKAIFRVLLDDADYKAFLEKKLDEEVAEFHKSKSPEELADIEEVIYALSCAYSTYGDVKTKQLDKYIERGGFFKRICLVDVKEGATNEQRAAD